MNSWLILPLLAGSACSSSSGNSKTETLTSVTDAGSACPSGGVTMQSGVDSNGNGVLDASEVTSTHNVCSSATSLVSTKTLIDGDTHCPDGGTVSFRNIDGGGSNNGEVAAITGSISCSGTLNISGGDGIAPAAGSGGVLDLEGNSGAQNGGAINMNGGDATGANGSAGGGGRAIIGADGGLLANTAIVTANGGAATASGGDGGGGGNIQLSAAPNGPVVNTGRCQLPAAFASLTATAPTARSTSTKIITSARATLRRCAAPRDGLASRP